MVYEHFRNIGIENMKIILIEEHCLENVEQLHREENNVIEMYFDDEFCLNSRYAVKDEDYNKKYNHQYRLLNKEYFSQKKKEWAEKNPEKCSLKKHEYYERNRNDILGKQHIYNQMNKDKQYERKKMYRETNKEKVTQHKKEYYENNKNILLQKQKEKIKCGCGTELRKSDLKRHERTLKHKNYISDLNEEAQTI